MSNPRNFDRRGFSWTEQFFSACTPLAFTGFRAELCCGKLWCNLLHSICLWGEGGEWSAKRSSAWYLCQCYHSVGVVFGGWGGHLTLLGKQAFPQHTPKCCRTALSRCISVTIQGCLAFVLACFPSVCKLEGGNKLVAPLMDAVPSRPWSPDLCGKGDYFSLLTA